jgi:uncharacterized membrane protein
LISLWNEKIPLAKEGGGVFSCKQNDMKGVHIMRHRFLKVTGIFAMVIVLFSIMGCSTQTESKNTANHHSKSAEVKKDQNQKGQASNVSTKIAINKNQPSVAQGASQQSTGAPAPKPSVSPASPKANAVQQQPAKNSAPAAPVQPSQPKPPTAASASKPAISSASAGSGQPQAQIVKITVIGPKGTILNGKPVNINNGETVLNVLIDAVGKTNVDYTGNGATVYVRGIDNIYQFDYGQMSGWNYSVNGTAPSISAGAVQVKAGDEIEWKYKES